VIASFAAAGCGSSSSSKSGSASTPAPSSSGSAGTPTPVSAKGKVPSRIYNIKLTGAAETPPGAPDGTGRASVSLRGKKLQVCWNVHSLRGFSKPTAAHIHIGAANTAGNVVVPLSTGAKFKRRGCVPASAAVISAIGSNPKGFYLNVHSARYPNGAVRAQL
jgi:hypothetical protein